MEVMQGTLADRLEGDGGLAPRAAVDAILQLITGLQAAVAVGILHRDIKPSNCFVDAYGTVKIGDFGISRSLRPTQETALSMDAIADRGTGRFFDGELACLPLPALALRRRGHRNPQSRARDPGSARGHVDRPAVRRAVENPERSRRRRIHRTCI
jgi:serine/threonine protein kinase